MALEARAFYDPGLQRWINRDPSGDSASLVYATAPLLLDAESDNAAPDDGKSSDVWVQVSQNLYGTLGNNPIGRLDAFGLTDNSLDACGRSNPGEVAKLARQEAAEGRAYSREALKRQTAKEAAQKGAKSYEEYMKHQNYVKQGLEKLKKLKKLLDRTKGPKAQGPVKEAIELEEKVLKGHLKEIAQKWPNGCPAAP